MTVAPRCASDAALPPADGSAGCGLDPSLPLAQDLLAHRRAARPDAGSAALLVPRSLSLPQREAPPFWETPRAATEMKLDRSPTMKKQVLRDVTY